MNYCALLFASLLTLQTTLNVAQSNPNTAQTGPAGTQTNPEVTTMDQAKLAPQSSDLNAPTDIERLQRWLERIFPNTCTGPECQPLLQEELWVGRLAGTKRLCQARLFYSTGNGFRSTFDVFLIFVGPTAEERSVAFRSTLIYGGSPGSLTFLPGLVGDEWFPRLPSLEASTQVNAKQVTLRSRPMLQGMTKEAFLRSGLHELVINFGPKGNPVSVKGVDVRSGETMTCNFGGGR